MLLSASLWKHNLFYLLHVLFQTWFLNIHLILVPEVSECEVSVSVSSGFLTWQCETTDQVCVVTVWHLCVCDVAVWSWSFRLVCSSKPVFGRRLLAVLANNGCICECWAYFTAWCDYAFNLRPNDVALHTGVMTKWTETSGDSILKVHFNINK